MNLAVGLLLLFIIIMFSGSMLPPIGEAATDVTTDGAGMGASTNVLVLLIPMFIIVVLLITVIKLTTQR